MGYSEIYCHICGVSFNIARIRTPIEPRTHAWSTYGRVPSGSLGTWMTFVDSADDDNRDHQCPRWAGCKLVFREDIKYCVDKREKERERWRPGNDGAVEIEEVEMKWFDDRNDKSLDEDGDFVLADIDDEEVVDEDGVEYEFETPPESCCGSIGMADGISDVSMDENAGDTASIREYSRFCQSLQRPQKIWSEHFPDLARQIELNASGDKFQRFNHALMQAEAYTKRPHEEIMLPLYREPGQHEEHYLSAGEVAEEEPDSEDEDAKLFEDQEKYFAHGRLPTWGELSWRNHKLNGPTRRGRYTNWSNESNWEHVSGPDCIKSTGYSGSRIGFEEMQYCNTLQCLVPKPGGWQADDNDEVWEQTTEFTLSGLSDHMPSRDEDSPRIYPARKAIGSPMAENVIWDRDTDNQYGMPFHPSCFEVFKRASARRNGSLDVNSLTSWWQLNATYDGFHGLKRAPAVKKAEEQSWEHNVGDEWLAADPCFVPEMSQPFEPSVQCQSNKDRNICHVPPGNANTLLKPAQVPRTATISDSSSPFEQLPREIHRLIFTHLSSFDITSLCSVVSDLQDLAQTFLHKRLLLERPYLWELWCKDPYSRWTGTTSLELKARHHNLSRRQRDLDEMIEVLKEEGHRELAAEMRNWQAETAEKTEAELLGPAWQPKAALTYDSDEIDFVRLARNIEQGLAEDRLKGLRNRERIWRDCEMILGQIEDLRAEGKILENGKLARGAD